MGYATEPLKGLVVALEGGPQICLLAGVDTSNAASAKVLEKAGFKRLTERSTANRDYFELFVT
jgi:RimJ/RimL family protein N-acetyltransferase